MIEKITKKYFYIIIFLKIIDLTVWVPNDNPINKFVIITGIILLFCDIIQNKFKINYKYPMLLKLYILSVIITLIMKFNIITLREVFFEIYYIFILFFLAQKWADQKTYDNIYKIIIATTFIVVAVFFVQYFIYGKNMVFRNINGGSVLVALNIMIIILLKPKLKINKIIKAILLVIYIIFMLLSYSRTSIIAAIFAGIIYAIRRLLSIKYIKSVAILFIILLFAINSLNYKNFESYNIQNFEEKINSVLSNRYYLWKYGIKSMEGNVLFGIGADIEGKIIENIPQYIVDTQSIAQKQILSASNLHNGYIQLLVEHGIVGLGIMIIYLYTAIKKIPKFEKKKYILTLCLLINLCENQLLLSNSVIVILFWMILGDYTNNIYTNSSFENVNKKQEEYNKR